MSEVVTTEYLDRAIWQLRAAVTALPVASIPPKVAAGMLRAQRAAKAVWKDGKHAQGYQYAKSETVIDEGRLALNEGDLVLLPASVKLVLLEHGEQEDRSDDKESREKSRLRAFLRCDYVLVHVDGDAFGFQREWPCIVQKGRPLDKAEGGALTTALAYTYRDLLGIPRDDELAAMDRRDDRPDDKPAKRDDDRDIKPANDHKPNDRDVKPDNASEEDDARPVVPRTSEHPFTRLLPLIQGRKLAGELLAGEIDRADCDAEERVALDLVSVAYRATKPEEVTALGAKVRASFKDNDKGIRLREWVLKAIRPAWDALSKPVEPARAAS